MQKGDPETGTETETKSETRRSILRKMGSVGAGATVATGGLAVATREARGMIVVRFKDIYSAEVDAVCDLGPEGLGLWAATEWAAGRATVYYLGVAAAGTEFACAARDEFVQHFPDADRIEFKRADHNWNDIDKGDIVIVPKNDGWDWYDFIL